MTADDRASFDSVHEIARSVVSLVRTVLAEHWEQPQYHCSPAVLGYLQHVVAAAGHYATRHFRTAQASGASNSEVLVQRLGTVLHESPKMWQFPATGSS